MFCFHILGLAFRGYSGLFLCVLLTRGLRVVCFQSSVCKNPPRVRKLARRNGLQERSSSRHGGDVHRPDYAVPCGNCGGGAQPCTDHRKCAQLWSFDGGGIGLKCACFRCWICLVIEGRNGTRSTTMLVEGGGKHICVCEALEEFVSFWLLVYGGSEERELPWRAYVCSRFDVECSWLKQSGDEEGVSQEFGRRVVLE